MYKKFLFLSLIIYAIAVKEEQFHFITSDDISGGSFKYYSLNYEGDLELLLKSQIGDADLYASEIHINPRYDPDSYCLKSATCGDDLIHIPKSFKRPVYIGIYGHPSHSTSKYDLFLRGININTFHTSRRRAKKQSNTENENTSNIFNAIKFLFNYILYDLFRWDEMPVFYAFETVNKIIISVKHLII